MTFRHESFRVISQKKAQLSKLKTLVSKLRAAEALRNTCTTTLLFRTVQLLSVLRRTHDLQKRTARGVLQVRTCNTVKTKRSKWVHVLCWTLWS
jgi:hypothetical protein